MKFKPNYIFIPLITVLVAVIGGAFTSIGMPWYDATLIQPELTPPKWAFPVAWNTIFVLTTISALIVWNKGTGRKGFLAILLNKKPSELHWWIVGLFILNAILNVAWSLLFFVFQMIGAAFVEMIFLELTLVLLIGLTWKVSRLASVLLLPYAAWVGFASYLTYQIWLLNV